MSQDVVAAPSFSPGGGTYAVKQIVTLTSGTSRATIHYTTDGTTPTTSSPKYGKPISVSRTATINAIAVKWRKANSPVASATYSISDSTSSDTATYGIPWKSWVTYDSLTDARDGQSYRTVTIGSQTWMAENLNYAGTGAVVGSCYNSSVDSCAKYGRLYTWASLMNLADSCNTKACSSQVQPRHRGICPSGWHIPSDAEWAVLVVVAGGIDLAGRSLKSSSGWKEGGNGVDCGFRALPGGSAYGGVADYGGRIGFWWSSKENSVTSAWNWNMLFANTTVGRTYNGKENGMSARCLMD